MFKSVAAVTLIFATAYAGILHAPLVAAPIAHVAPVAHIAPVAHVVPIAVKSAVPVATSYQSTVQVSHGSVPVVAAAHLVKAPLIAAPVLHVPAYKSVVLSHGHI